MTSSRLPLPPLLGEFEVVLKAATAREDVRVFRVVVALTDNLLVMMKMLMVMMLMVMKKMLMVIKLIIMVMVAAYHLHFAELEAVVHLGLALPLNGSASRVGW